MCEKLWAWSVRSRLSSEGGCDPGLSKETFLFAEWGPCSPAPVLQADDDTFISSVGGLGYSAEVASKAPGVGVGLVSPGCLNWSAFGLLLAEPLNVTSKCILSAVFIWKKWRGCRRAPLNLLGLSPTVLFCWHPLIFSCQNFFKRTGSSPNPHKSSIAPLHKTTSYITRYIRARLADESQRPGRAEVLAVMAYRGAVELKRTRFARVVLGGGAICQKKDEFFFFGFQHVKVIKNQAFFFIFLQVFFSKR